MERRGVRTVAGDLWRAAYERLELVQGVVAELRAGLGEVVAQVKDLAERGVTGLRERLRGADLSELKAANKAVEEERRTEAERALQVKMEKEMEEIKEIYKGFERQRERER